MKPVFEDLGVPVKRAGFRGCLVAPDASGKKDLLYFNFNQIGGRLFLLSIDPDTGESHQYEAPEGPGAWGFTLGPDGRIYLGTWDGGLILRFDPARPDLGISVVGRPSETETYIWMFALGGDGRLYGGTYGNAKLISYDPRTGEMRDLGRMSDTEMYSRTVAAGKDGRIYVGIGTSKGDIVVYDPRTNTHRSIAPEEIKAGAKGGSTQQGCDGHAYAQIGSRWFRCEDSRLIPVDEFPGAPTQRFRDGRVLEEAGDGHYLIRQPDGTTTKAQFTYEGTGSQIFVVGNGPMGRIYGSSVMPLELFEYDPATGRLTDLGNPTPVSGEIYSMATLEGRLYVCAYPGSWLSVYDPSKPWDYGTAKDSNPRGIGYAGDGHLRPRAMVVGPDDCLYIGSHPPYGEHGGAMAVYDPALDAFRENYRNIIASQSIVSLAYEPKSGLVFGGSSIAGGGGTRPVGRDAHLFAWDPKRKEKALDMVPVQGDSAVVAMTIFGNSVIAVSTPSNRLLRFDVDADRLTVMQPLPARVPDLSLQSQGQSVYGIAGSRVFRLDPLAWEVVLLDAYPGPITAGFALNRTGLYFGSNTHLIRYASADLRFIR